MRYGLFPIWDEPKAAAGIYAIRLADGRTYVGQAKNCKRRIAQHMQPYHVSARGKKSDAIRVAMECGEKIECAVIQWADKDLNTQEQAWIDSLSKAGVDLLNTEMEVGRFTARKHGPRSLPMPWGDKQAPLQKSLIALRRIAREIGSADLEAKAERAQVEMRRLKRDPAQWLAANLMLVERRPSMKTWSEPVKIGDGWY